MRRLGLVGGISWVSTIDYYRYINEGVNERLGGLNYAECLVYSLNFGDIQARTWPNSLELLQGACTSLEAGGAEAIVLCANTAHLAADQLQLKVPLIHIVSATATAVQKQGLTKVGFLGTKFTMEMAFYRDGLRAAGIEPLIPEDTERRDYIQQTVKEELGRGIVRPETKGAYLAIIRDLIDRGAEGIVLACTEIPLLITQQDLPIPVFDTARIHAQAAVDFALAPATV
jgi:aspartate racemase